MIGNGAPGDEFIINFLAWLINRDAPPSVFDGILSLDRSAKEKS